MPQTPKRPLADPEWFVEWANRFNDYVKHHQKALQVWASLAVAGAALKPMMFYLAIYTHPRRPGLSELDDLRRDYGKYRAILTETDALLKEAFAAVKEMGRELPLSDVMEYLKQQTGHNLEEVLGSYLTVIENDILPFYARRSSMKGAQRVEIHIVRMFVYMLRLMNRECYSDLAYLLEAAYAAHGTNETVSPDTVTKLVTRYIEAYPEHIAAWMDCDLDSIMSERPLQFFSVPPIPPPRN